MADEIENERESAWYQQGDVTIKPINAIPTDATNTGGRVLAEGEATGHKHVAEAEDVGLFQHEGALYRSAPPGTTVAHDEHHVLDIPPGDYLIGTVREYDHFAEVARPIWD